MSTDPYSQSPNPAQPQKTNTKLILLIVGGILVIGGIPCLGIMAAIAIPAFLRYTKASKAAEAGLVLRQMANEAQMHALNSCKFPPELPRHADIEQCSGGAKCMPAAEIPAPWSSVSALQNPTYFTYSATLENGEMKLRAEADFNAGSSLYHTEEITLTMNECEVEQSEVFVYDEFE